jgi:hypothetical protein
MGTAPARRSRSLVLRRGTRATPTTITFSGDYERILNTENGWRLASHVAPEEVSRMLEWKPKLIALLVLLVTLAVLFGQLSWSLFDLQLSW